MYSDYGFNRSGQSNPGAATPQSLFKMYKDQAAVTANPYTLRQFASHGMDTGSNGEADRLIGIGPSSHSHGYESGHTASVGNKHIFNRRRASESPPRASFRCVHGSGKSSGYTSNMATFLHQGARK